MSLLGLVLPKLPDDAGLAQAVQMCLQPSMRKQLTNSPHAARRCAEELGPEIDAFIRLNDNHWHSHGCALRCRICTRTGSQQIAHMQG